MFQAKRDLLGEDGSAEAAHVLEGPWVRGLLAGQQADGGFGVNVYGKWGGAHWRLVSLVELGVPAGEPRCVAAAETVLAWLTGKSPPRGREDDQRAGAPLRLAGGERARRLLPARACRRSHASGCWRSRSSSGSGRTAAGTATRTPPAGARPSTSRCAPMWGLHEYWVGDRETRRRKMLPLARLSSSSTTGSFARSRLASRSALVRDAPLSALLALRHPPALVVLSRMGLAPATRARRDAVELVEERRLSGRPLARRRTLVEAAGLEG